MIVGLQTRKSKIHIIKWCTSQGKYHTMCGETFTKQDQLNVFGADNTIPGICHNCTKLIDRQYLVNLNYPATSRGILLENAVVKYISIRMPASTAYIYEDSLDSRYWSKLRRYQKKINR
jgi:hypothetical protein